MQKPTVIIANYGLKVSAKMLPESWKDYMGKSRATRNKKKTMADDLLGLACVIWEILSGTVPQGKIVAEYFRNLCAVIRS
jgi:hypothetical protein